MSGTIVHTVEPPIGKVMWNEAQNASLHHAYTLSAAQTKNVPRWWWFVTSLKLIRSSLSWNGRQSVYCIKRTSWRNKTHKIVLVQSQLWGPKFFSWTMVFFLHGWTINFPPWLGSDYNNLPPQCHSIGNLCDVRPPYLSPGFYGLTYRTVVLYNYVEKFAWSVDKTVRWALNIE